jgi:hypothetical protein
VKASFAATRAFLSVRKQRRGLVVNIGLGMGSCDESCPVRYTLLGFAHGLGLMELDNIEVANLCLHILSGDKRGTCCRCASDALAFSNAAVPFQHLCLASYTQVNACVLDVVDRFRESLVGEKTGG